MLREVLYKKFSEKGNLNIFYVNLHLHVKYWYWLELLFGIFCMSLSLDYVLSKNMMKKHLRPTVFSLNSTSVMTNFKFRLLHQGSKPVLKITSKNFEKTLSLQCFLLRYKF